MHCSACGNDNQPGRRFCSQCGEKLVIHCAKCDFSNDADDKFCGGCGFSLVSAKDGATIEATPSNVASQSESVQSESVQGEAGHRQLTVMFCDLADSTAMSSRLDPEELSKINRLYQETCTNLIEQNDGYIARYMGDGILCYFGYPRAHENDAELSVRAALAIQEKFSLINQTKQTEETLSVRIGIATGPVVVGEIVGSGSSRESTAVGMTPNLAARLQSLAEPGSVVIAGETRILVGAHFSYRCLGSHELKGIQEPVEAWAVEGESKQASRFSASQKRELTPFIGRRHERALIEDCYQQAQENSGQVVMLCGEPGIGKSRLIEFAMSLNPASVTTLQCSSYHLNSALYPLIELLKSRSEKYGEDENWIENMLQKKNIQDPDGVPLFELLLSGVTDKKISIPGTQMQKQRSLELATDILIHAEASGPAIVAIEDLHWMDPTSQDLVNRLVFAAAQNSILVLLSFRPEYDPVWIGQSHVHQLNLNRINPNQCEEMIVSLMGEGVSSAITRQIAERTDGNPLYIEEMIQTLVTSKEQGDGSDLALKIPMTLADSLNARLDNLGSARSTAQAAAVIGRDFNMPLLSEITRAPMQELEQDITTLLASGLIYCMDEAEGNYRFKHALIQDSAYVSLLKENRVRFHNRAALFLEQSEDSETRFAGLVAHHFIQSDNQICGLHYCRKAGDHALATMAVEEAREHFSNALLAISKIPDNTDLIDQKVRNEELLSHIGHVAAYRLLEDYEKAQHSLNRAEALATELGDLKALADICHSRGNIYFPLGDHDGVLREHSRGREFARQLESIELEVRSIGGLGDAYYVRGEMLLASQHFSECCEISKKNGFDEYFAANCPMIGWSQIYQLEMEEALENGKQSIEVAQKCGHFRGEMNANALLGFVYAELLEIELSRKHMDISIDMSEKTGSGNFGSAFVVFKCRSYDAHADRELMYRNTKSALEIQRRYGMFFHGVGTLGALLLVSNDSEERDTIIKEAESILEKGCVAHNYLWFYELALQAALNNRDWKQLEYFRQRNLYFDKEKTARTEFFVQRSSVLEHFYRDRVTADIEMQRQQLIATCRQRSMLKSMRELESVTA